VSAEPLPSAQCRDDAAYLLGALSPSERLEFEAHLNGCAACQRSVQELAGLPGLLGKVRPTDFSTPAEQPPETLLASLTATVRSERASRRWWSWGLTAAAAVSVLLLAFALHTVLFPSSPPAVGLAMTQVRETSVQATAQLSDKPWGTQIRLLCHYRVPPSYGKQPRTYTLVVINRAGATQQVATWRVVPSGVSAVTGSTGWHRADISKLEVRAPNGAAVLRLDT
jgi:Putative zinc-finger